MTYKVISDAKIERMSVCKLKRSEKSTWVLTSAIAAAAAAFYH